MINNKLKKENFFRGHERECQSQAAVQTLLNHRALAIDGKRSP